jgi:predicted DNA-binding transcriptional regulator YafY
MLNLLLSNQRIKISELAEIIGVKERMIRKYKEDLIGAGFNIVSQPGKGGGYILENDEKNEFQRFSNNELDAIQKMIEHHQHLSSYYENEYELESILTKIKGYSHCISSGEVRTTSYFDYALPNVNFENEKEKLTDIKEAIKNHNKMKIEYFSVSSGLTTRVIHPLSLIYRKGFWYTNAFCERKQKPLIFKNCRISACEKLTEKFEKKVSTTNLTKIGKHFGISGEDEIEVILKIEFPMSLYIRERVWAYNQKIETHVDDYSIVFKGTMSGYPEVKRWVLGMGSKVEVISPLYLRDSIIQEMRTALSKVNINVELD